MCLHLVHSVGSGTPSTPGALEAATRARASGGLVRDTRAIERVTKLANWRRILVEVVVVVVVLVVVLGPLVGWPFIVL